jgi:hypothetical protein
MKQNIKVVIGIALMALFVFGFVQIQTKEPPPIQQPNSQQLITNALLKKGVDIDTVLITNGSEASKAFDISNIKIPENSKIVFVMFRAPYTKGSDGILEEHVTIIYTCLDADQTIDGVMALEVGFAEATQKVFIIYADRATAQKIDLTNLTAEEVLNNFGLIEFEIQ